MPHAVFPIWLDLYRPLIRYCYSYNPTPSRHIVYSSGRRSTMSRIPSSAQPSSLSHRSTNLRIELVILQSTASAATPAAATAAASYDRLQRPPIRIINAGSWTRQRPEHERRRLVYVRRQSVGVPLTSPDHYVDRGGSKRTLFVLVGRALGGVGNVIASITTHAITVTFATRRRQRPRRFDLIVRISDSSTAAVPTPPDASPGRWQRQ